MNPSTYTSTVGVRLPPAWRRLHCIERDLLLAEAPCLVSERVVEPLRRRLCDMGFGGADPRDIPRDAWWRALDSCAADLLRSAA